MKCNLEPRAGINPFSSKLLWSGCFNSSNRKQNQPILLLFLPRKIKTGQCLSAVRLTPCAPGSFCRASHPSSCWRNSLKPLLCNTGDSWLPDLLQGSKECHLETDRPSLPCCAQCQGQIPPFSARYHQKGKGNSPSWYPIKGL